MKIKFLGVFLLLAVQACQSLPDSDVYGKPGHSETDIKNAIKMGRYVVVEYTLDGADQKSGFKVGCKAFDGFGKTCDQKISYQNITRLSQQRSGSEKMFQWFGIGMWESFWAWVW